LFVLFKQELQTFFVFLCLPPAAAKRKREIFGDTPHPGKGLRPLHSWFEKEVFGFTSYRDKGLLAGAPRP
jgi:hypothetical protein